MNTGLSSCGQSFLGNVFREEGFSIAAIVAINTCGFLNKSLVLQWNISSCSGYAKVKDFRIISATSLFLKRKATLSAT